MHWSPWEEWARSLWSWRVHPIRRDVEPGLVAGMVDRVLAGSKCIGICEEKESSSYCGLSGFARESSCRFSGLRGGSRAHGSYVTVLPRGATRRGATSIESRMAPLPLGDVWAPEPRLCVRHWLGIAG